MIEFANADAISFSIAAWCALIALRVPSITLSVINAAIAAVNIYLGLV